MARSTLPSRRRRLGALLAVSAAALAGCGDDQVAPCSSRDVARPDVAYPPVCIGVDPGPGAQSAEPSGEPVAQNDAGFPAPPELGSPAPDWKLEDFQPQSCGHGGVYGLEAFRGLVTVVAVWAGS
ncbi:MAG: hypothetical protein JRI23_29100 [Deltaproteobacteria bacterium]|jgi:hypothetical protein|nr:hypothetical protein [Deltaproteobacteria bacterium]MBW2536189.1 hypothetical protein [Deltaproteobacteria bacterium]